VTKNRWPGAIPLLTLRARSALGPVVFLLQARQLARFVIGFAVELLNFFAKVRAVITVRVRKRPSLTLVIPIIGIQSLRFFEVRNCIDAFALFVEMLSQRKLRVSANAVVALRFQSRSYF